MLPDDRNIKALFVALNSEFNDVIEFHSAKIEDGGWCSPPEGTIPNPPFPPKTSGMNFN